MNEDKPSSIWPWIVVLLWCFGNPCVAESKGCANAQDVVLRTQCKDQCKP